MSQTIPDYLDSIIDATDNDGMPDNSSERLEWYARRMIRIRQAARAAKQQIEREAERALQALIRADIPISEWIEIVHEIERIKAKQDTNQ